MTAKDVEMARALVTILEGESFSNTPSVTYDPESIHEVEDVDTAELWVSGTLIHRRTDRRRSSAGWASDVTLMITALSKQTEAGSQGEEDSVTEKDGWLAFIDEELVSAIQSNAVSGHFPSSIEFSPRLDLQQLRNNSIFRTQLTIRYLAT